MKFAITVMALAAGLAGCLPQPEIKSRDFYVKNTSERRSMVERCKTLAGAEKDENCINARHASIVEMTEPRK